ncbi:MAG TPA: hypothetical protein EYG71_07630 [Leucothrix sp.]|nr:hypothetical protein [Leucothrix sp.]
MNKTLYKTITSLFLGVAVLFSAPSVFADNGERGWKKHDRHLTNKYNKQQNKRHNKKHRKNRWVRNNHDHSTCNVRSHNHNTRHNNTRYNNTRHHNTRHNNIRHNIRHNNTRFNDVFNSLVIDFASSSNAYPSNNHYATNNKRNIWDRQKNQKRRIRKGVKSGQLTHQETKKLRRGLRRIRDKIAYFKSDGHFVRQERRTVHNMLDRSSDRIYRKKHNNVTRSNQRSNQHRDHRTANNNGRYNYYH